MKCKACQNNECQRKYENRHKCTGKKEDIECTCSCQVTRAQEITTSAMSIGVGVAAAAGGVALTFMTGGLFAVISGAALIGAGSSMVMNPIQKQITGECMTISDIAQDIALGATIGAITGPIGSAGGSVAAKAGSGLAKFGIRMGTGAVAGAVSGTATETAKVIRGEEVSMSSFAKSVGIGAAAGSIGGMSTHLSSNVTKKVSSEVGKAITRVSVQATSAAATDATLQFIDKGEIDTKQLLLNTAGQITVATTAEISQNISKGTVAYNKKVNSELISDDLEKKSVQNPKERQALLEQAAKSVSEVSPSTLEENQGQWKSQKIGDRSIHALRGKRQGQVAADLSKPNPETGERSGERAVFVKKDGKYVYLDHSLEHDYKGMRRDVDGLIRDPFGAIRPENIGKTLAWSEDRDTDKDEDGLRDNVEKIKQKVSTHKMHKL